MQVQVEGACQAGSCKLLYWLTVSHAGARLSEVSLHAADQGPLLLRLADMGLQAARCLHQPQAAAASEQTVPGSLADARQALQVRFG